MDVFSRQIGRAIGRPSWAPMLYIAMTLVLGRERAEAMMASQRIVPEKAEALGYRFQHTDSAEALRSILSR
jgi:NAD dependent epimerase/dehydratase family enzyme